MTEILVPIYNSYQVEGNLYAGEYPGDLDPGNARTKTNQLVGFGVTDFIDLTEANELYPYECYLPKDATRHNFPLQDLGIPKKDSEMESILETINTLLRKGSVVYVHCWGGVGRTGTVVACWLGVQNNVDGPKALEMLSTRWNTCPKSRRADSPQTQRQCRYVCEFLERRKHDDT
ncbi:MAG: protein-tyrosine phosphatase family protein [Thermoguttaceae bacterium]|nr:protein-tyrosine phosphatase family protein [Thermoguttaceae bacterium]